MHRQRATVWRLLRRRRHGDLLVLVCILATTIGATALEAKAEQAGPAVPRPGELTAPTVAAGIATTPSAPPPGLSPDPIVRAAQMRPWALTPAGLKWVGAALIYDADARVRRAAAEAIGAVGFVPHTLLLESAAKNDRAPEVRLAAANAHRHLLGLAKSPRLAAGYSLLCPGCGYFHLDQPKLALAFLGTTAAALGTGLALLVSSARSTTAMPSAGTDGPASPFKDARGPIGLQLVMAGQNLWLYSVYAAYRDARAMRADAGYRIAGTRETLADLAIAPVRPRALLRPWFWAGLPILFGAALGLSAVLEDDFPGNGGRWLNQGRQVNFLGRQYSAGVGFALGESYHAALFWPVGIGEEALFRGVLQPALSEDFGPWGGWALSSLVFGAAHIGNFVGGQDGQASAGLLAVPFITLVGGYLGFVSMQTGYQLESSVALHFWYDFLLGTASFLSDPDHQPFTVRLGWGF